MNSFRMLKLAVVGMLALSGVQATLADTIQYSFTQIRVPGEFPLTSSTYLGINDSGQIVGSYTDRGGQHGFLETEGKFTSIDVPASDVHGFGYTNANGISNDGMIVGTYIDSALGTRSFLYFAGSFTYIDIPGATLTSAFGVNDSSQIVGVYRNSNRNHAFLDSAGNFTTIDFPGAVDTRALGINDSGQIVGDYSDGRITRGFVYTAGTFTTIDFPGGSLAPTLPGGINDSGEIVGYYVSRNVAHGFVDTAGSFVSFDAGGLGTQAYGINDSSQIVGIVYYLESDGRFLATLVPEPRTLPILAGCLIGLFAFGRRRREAIAKRLTKIPFNGQPTITASPLSRGPLKA